MHLIRHRQRGVTLLESMVALVVISIGLLGIAAMQITSMGLNASALRNSQAVWSGYNMADRVRANITEFANYDGIDTSTSYSQNCMSGPCTNAQMVTADAQDWGNELQNLPGGRGTITGNANLLVISVMWDDDGTGATGIDCGNNPKVDLTCFTMTLVQ
jgi:type IV pilus assembly protein PilV